MTSPRTFGSGSFGSGGPVAAFLSLLFFEVFLALLALAGRGLCSELQVFRGLLNICVFWFLARHEAGRRSMSGVVSASVPRHSFFFEADLFSGCGPLGSQAGSPLFSSARCHPGSQPFGVRYGAVWGGASISWKCRGSRAGHRFVRRIQRRFCTGLHDPGSRRRAFAQPPLLLGR